MFCWILSASFSLASGVSTTSPSTPAVKRPALRSVTRRTLTSVFARGAEHQLLQVADPPQVPRLRCREDPLTQPPYARLANTPINLAPAEVRVLWSVHHDGSLAVSNLPSAPGSSSSSSSQAHLTASAPFRAGPRRPISDRLSRTAGGGPAIMSRFPVAFRLPASLFGHPIPAEEFGPPHGRLTGPEARTSTGSPRSRTHELQPGWVPPLPRGRRRSSRLTQTSTGACRFSAASPCTPLPASISEALITGHRRRVTRFTRPAFPLRL